MISTFSHKRCGGQLFMDILGMFTLRVPSLSVTPEGITVGVCELLPKTKGSPVFRCSKCDNEIDVTSSDEIQVKCSICHEDHSVTKTFCTYHLDSVCEDCLLMLTGEKKPTEEIKKITARLVLPKTGIKYVTYAEVLKMKLNF